MRSNPHFSYAKIEKMTNINVENSNLLKLYHDSILQRADYLTNILNNKKNKHFTLDYFYCKKDEIDQIPESLIKEMIVISNHEEMVSAVQYIVTTELGYTEQSYFDALHLYEQVRLQQVTLKKQQEQIQKEIHIINTSLKNTKLQNEWLVKENSESNDKRSHVDEEYELLTTTLHELESQLSNNKKKEGELRSQIQPLTLLYDEKHLELLNVTAQWEELKNSMHFGDAMLHPRKSLENRKKLKELLNQKETLITLVEDTNQKKSVLSKELEEVIEKIESLQNEIEENKSKQELAQKKITNHISHIDSGEKMISNGIDRLEKLEIRKNEAENRLEMCVIDLKNLEDTLITYAKDLLHVYVGYNQEYQEKLHQITQEVEFDVEILKDLLFAPYLFVIDKK